MSHQFLYHELEKAMGYVENFSDEEKKGKIFLVTGNKSYDESGAAVRLDKLNAEVTRFSDFSSNPNVDDVWKGVDLYWKTNPALILAVGGGSVIDMAKLIKGLALYQDPREVIHGKYGIKPSRVDIVAVPTTSGSGSESTPFAVVYVDGVKHSLEHPELLPRRIVLDPTLTYNLSKKQTAISGMDALSQGIESFWSVKGNDFSRAFAREGLYLALKNIEGVVNNPNPFNRKNMMEAANLSGRAIAISQTTACHSISYPLTSRFGIPHGHAVALTLGEMLEYNTNFPREEYQGSDFDRHNENMDNLMKNWLDVKDGKEANAKIKDLMQKIGLETRLSKLGLKREDLDIIVKEGFNTGRVGNNPRKLTADNLRTILERIY